MGISARAHAAGEHEASLKQFCPGLAGSCDPVCASSVQQTRYADMGLENKRLKDGEDVSRNTRYFISLLS